MPSSNDGRSCQALRGRITLLLRPDLIRVRRSNMYALVDVKGIARGVQIGEVTTVASTEVVGISSVRLKLSLVSVLVIRRIIMNGHEGIKGLRVVSVR